MTANESVSLRVDPRRKYYLLSLCAALAFGLWALQVTPYLNVADDSGRYMVLGKSLARTGDLRLINDARRQLDTLYPPGFPAIIAFWLRLTGRPPGGVVFLVKLTQIALLIGTFPLLYRLLERARLSFPYIAVALLTAATCPSLISNSNIVMSEISSLFLCLASLALVEQGVGCRVSGVGENPAKEKGARKKAQGESPTTQLPNYPTTQHPTPNTQRPTPLHPFTPSPFLRILALACAAAAFLVRTAAAVLLLVQVVWFFWRFGWKWGLVALVVALVSIGGWQMRNRHIIQSHPDIHYSTYLNQFALRDPNTPGAGRIEINASGLWERAQTGLPSYVGMIPRALLYQMAPPDTPWLKMFYVVAIPLTLLILLGYGVGWQRGMILSNTFFTLFWLATAMWPWRSARFLIPVAPLLILYLFLGVECVSNGLQKHAGILPTRIVQSAAFALLLVYFVRVHINIIRQERVITAPGYPMGRHTAEGGFYSACAWIQQHAEPNTVVMGKPPYLLHLYTDHPTVQLEPSLRPINLEKAYILPNRVRYLLQDAWTFGSPRTSEILVPYLHEYAAYWKPVWTDPLGSGARVWQRIAPPPASPLPKTRKE